MHAAESYKGPAKTFLNDAVFELYRRFGVESSLLAREIGGRRLLRILQTVQAFGRDKLDQTGLLQTVENRHGEVYAARCRQLGEEIASVNEAKAANAIYDEMSNLRAAFERALTRDMKLATQLAAPLFLFNYLHRGAETGDWYERIMVRPGTEDLEQAPILLAGAAGHAFHDEGDEQKAAAFIQRGFRAEARGSRSSEGWLSGVAGQMAQWSGDTKKCIEHHTRAVEQARRAGNTACEITSLCMAAFVKARTGDLDGAGEMVAEVTRIGRTAMQPTMMGYIHYARGGVESFKDANRAIEEYQTSVEWANMAGNHLGGAAPAPATAFGQRDGGGDPIDPDHAEMFAVGIYRRQGFELRHEVADLARVVSFANGFDFLQAQLGGRIDPAGIDPESLAFQYRGAFGSYDLSAYFDDLAILNQQRTTLQGGAVYGIDVRVLNQHGFGREGRQRACHQ